MGGTCLQRELERLAFWSSDRIAPHVRTCYIALFRASITLDPVPSPFVAALFEAVSRFTNLRHLSCNFAMVMVELPALRVENLSHLETLQIHGPRLSWPNRPTAFGIRVPNFSYTEVGIPADESRLSCFAMLNPTALRCLELSAGRGRGLEHFLGDKAAIAACRNLHTLRIAFKDTDFTRIHACIAPFPALRELTVELKGTFRADAMPSTPLAPLLDRYKGPVELLPLVLGGAGQRHS